jgi:hypothetical protein
MLRWNMHFATGNAAEYLRQLSALGAILAIPVPGKLGGTEFLVVRDLLQRPRVHAAREDVGRIQRIYWIDDKPESVTDVMREMGLEYRPNRFVAFMPAELEQKLFAMEREYYKRNYGTFNEERICETRFEVEAVKGKITPRLASMTLKPD